NWISISHSLYMVYTKNRPDSKFIVVQHGTYIGGIVTDIAHKYAKCNIYYTWGDYFTRMFSEYNQRKSVKIEAFGNPVYNQFQRNDFSYKDGFAECVLLAPSATSGKRLEYWLELGSLLADIGMKVSFKGHKFQSIDNLKRMKL